MARYQVLIGELSVKLSVKLSYSLLSIVTFTQNSINQWLNSIVVLMELN